MLTLLLTSSLLLAAPQDADVRGEAPYVPDWYKVVAANDLDQDSDRTGEDRPALRLIAPVNVYPMVAGFEIADARSGARGGLMISVGSSDAITWVPFQVGDSGTALLTFRMDAFVHELLGQAPRATFKVQALVTGRSDAVLFELSNKLEIVIGVGSDDPDADAEPEPLRGGGAYHGADEAHGGHLPQCKIADDAHRHLGDRGCGIPGLRRRADADRRH